MDEFLILLQAKLDEAKSKGLINSDITTIQNQLDKLKLQATLDPQALSNIVKQLESITGKKITIPNIEFNAGQAVKDAQQTGQNIGNAVRQGASSILKSIKRDIANEIKEIPTLDASVLIKNNHLNRADVGTDVIEKIKQYVSEINKLGVEVAKTNNDSAWEQLYDKCNNLGRVLDKYSKTRSYPGIEEIERFVGYFKGMTIDVGYKNSGLSGTDFNIKKLESALKGLGIKFSATKQEAIALDTVWEEMCNTTGRMDLFNITNAQDQLQIIIKELLKAKSILHGEKGLVPNPSAHSDVSDYMSKIERSRDNILNLKNEEASLMQKEAQESTASANTVVQNEERKQQAIRNTAKIQQQLKENGNIIHQTDFAVSFDTKEQAEEYFNTLSKTVSIQEKLGENKNLKSFIVEVKNAEGVVERLTYKYNELNNTFEYSGGSINNNGVIKQVNMITAKADSLQTMLDKLKANYSDINSSRPIKDSGNISSLSQQYDKVSQAIESVRNADNATFSSMVSNAQREITALESMVAQFRNAENVATQMKSVDISSGIVQAQERLGKLKANSTGFEQMTQTLRELDTAITNVGDKSSLDAFIDKLRVAESQLGRVKAETKAITQDNKIQIKAETLKNKLEEFSQKNYGFSTWKKDINGVTISFESLISSLNTIKSIDDLKIITDQANALKSSFLAVKANADAVRTEISDLNKSVQQANKIQLSIETGGYESKVDSLIARTRQWTDANGNARISTDNLSLAFDKLLSASNAFSDNKTIANQQALIKAENELNIEIEKVTNSVRKRNAEFAKDATISSLHNQIQKFYDDNGAAHRKWGAQLKQMLSETASGAELTKERVTEIKTAFNGVASAAQQAGKIGKTWFQSFKDAAKFLTYWTSPTFITMKTIAEIKQGINTVKELDTALVDLKKTTTMTDSELENFYYDSNKVAKQMGVATEEITNQAAAWSRLGFSSEAMATKMAKYSSMFSSISPGLDLDSATNGLVSTMKAYSIGLNNADEVVDGIMSKINIIGNSKALNNSDIVDFLTRSSSALASANNSIEESIAMGEAIVEITRDAAGAGQVMKTTSMRIRGYDEELESYTEDLENLKGEIADLTKTAKTPGGISLFTDETKETYKSTYKILEEISGIWNDLTDKNQAQLLEVLAGKRNGQALAALISNFKSAQESMDLMANSAGNAEKEMSVIMDSLDFKLNRLSETGTSVAQNLFKRDDMKTVVDGLTSVMNVIDSLTSKLGMFGSIGLGAGIFAGVKNIGKTCECMNFKSSVLCFEYALHA